MVGIIARIAAVFAVVTVVLVANQNLLIYNDADAFRGIIVGNQYHAAEIGYAHQSGWILDGGAVIERI